MRNSVKAMVQNGSEFLYLKLEKWWGSAHLMESEVKLKMRLAEHLGKWPHILPETSLQKTMRHLLRNFSMPTNCKLSLEFHLLELHLDLFFSVKGWC
jgi:hypothetical protein